MKFYFTLFLFFLSVIVYAQDVVSIAVAANAQFVARKLKEAFKKATGKDADVTVSSSGKLTAQIEQGAPFDVFMSADMRYPQELYNTGLTIDKPFVYAYGTLIIWSLQKRDLSKGIGIVANDDIQKIAVANPDLAPYGAAAVQALQQQKVMQKADSKIVYGESISQVNNYLLSGAVDVAFTAKSVVLDSAFANKGVWKEVDSKLYSPIAQGVVVIKSSAHLQAAKQWFQFLFSPIAKKIFKQYGYK